MCMLEEHSDALSLPSDVRRTSNFQKSVRSPVYKSSSKRTYAVRQKANEWQISPKALAAKGLRSSAVNLTQQYCACGLVSYETILAWNYSEI